MSITILYDSLRWMHLQFGNKTQWSASACPALVENSLKTGQFRWQECVWNNTTEISNFQIENLFSG